MTPSSPPRHYAGTEVPESKSLLDIEALLRRHGVDTVRWTTAPALIRIEFSWPYQGRTLGFRIDLVVPPTDPAGYKLEGPSRDQERRRLLRVLLNHIKAKLVAVEDGLADLQTEFMPYLIGAGDRTLGAIIAEELAAGRGANAQPLLAGPRGT